MLVFGLNAFHLTEKDAFDLFHHEYATRYGALIYQFMFLYTLLLMYDFETSLFHLNSTTNTGLIQIFSLPLISP